MGYTSKKQEMERKIKIIKKFAQDMGYTCYEEDYTCSNPYHRQSYKRKAHSIELSETSDSEGNPFSWAWFLDTYEEM